MRQLLSEDLRFRARQGYKICTDNQQNQSATLLAEVGYFPPPPPPVVKAENEVLKDIKLKNILFTVI